MERIDVAVIGGGPAGLMAAERAADRGASVTVFDAMPTVGRKFLLAGRSGLNLTHAEDYAAFLRRYGTTGPALKAAVDAFPPDALRAFAEGLGQETFVGSSGRVFPKAMKASPLLRAWLRRLARTGVRIRTRHRWTGWDDAGRLAFDTPDGPIAVDAAATVLALGGASWPRLGSDAAWVPILAARGVPIAPLVPANCGFDVAWSEVFRERNAGLPVKSVIATVDGTSQPGEFVVTRAGIEGSLVYAHAAALRDRLATGRPAVLSLDLAPGRTTERLSRDLARVDPKQSFANRLRKGAGLDGVKAALVRECVADAARLAPDALAAALKALPLAVAAPRPIAEAISTAGGIAFAGLTDRLELEAIPGVFAAGEMLDWEAPTGGYLLTACFATGRAAGDAAADRAAAP
jgi:uncharacterized flavoprotein (TIGR03862 family)